MQKTLKYLLILPFVIFVFTLMTIYNNSKIQNQLNQIIELIVKHNIKSL